MRIEKLELKNFRCFEHWERTFDPHVNVLIGKNGSGKTAILEAISFLLAWFVEGVGAGKRRHASSNDVRVVSFLKGKDLTLEHQSPMEIRGEGSLDGHPWKMSGNHQVGLHRSGAIRISGQWPVAALRHQAARLAEAVSTGEDVTLPVVAYFGTDRLWRPTSASSTTELLGPGSRLRGYADCLRPPSDFRQLEAWFQRMELVKLQEGTAPPMLDAVSHAIAACLEDWDGVGYVVKQSRLVAHRPKGQPSLPLHNLSDGVRNMIGVVGEIAYRAALLNPQLGADAAKKTPGIVLIDELDLHLHPSWQRCVLDDLRRTFPEVQLFGTTHSSIIVQSLRPGELVALDGQPSDYEHLSVEDVLEGVMGVRHVGRSLRWRRMMKAAKAYYRVLQSANGATAEEKERLKARLDKLSAPYGDNPAYIAFLEMEREAAGLGGSGK
jgi:predicted ATP-binding protein involved in virulence